MLQPLLNIHFSQKKRTSKTLWVFLIILLLLLVGWLYAERQVKFYIEAQIGRYQKGSIDIEALSISFIHNFPNINISLKGFNLKEGKSQIILERLTIVLDIRSIFDKKIVLRKIYAENGSLLIYNEKPRPLPTLLENAFKNFPELKTVYFHKVALQYHNLPKKQLWQVYFEELQLQLLHQKGYKKIRLQAQGEFEQLAFEKLKEGNIFLRNTTFLLDIDGKYDFQKKTLVLESKQSTLQNAPTTLAIHIKPEGLDLHIRSKQVALIDAFKWLPPRFDQYTKGHISRGFLTVNCVLTTTWEANINPSIRVDFQSEHLSIFHPESQDFIPYIQLKGYYHNGNPANRNNSVIALENVRYRKGNIWGKVDVYIADFDKYKVKIKAEGLLNLRHFHVLYPLKAVEYVRGNIFVKADAEGQFVVEKGKESYFKSQGIVQLQNVDFKLHEINVPFQKNIGKVRIQDKSLFIDSLTLHTPKSSLTLQGEMPNGIAFLLYNQGKLSLKAEAVSNFIDLDELLTLNNESPKNIVKEPNEKPYYLSISPILDLDFSGKIKAVNFEKFNAHDLDFAMEVKDQKLTLKSLHAKALGGSLYLQLEVSTALENLVKVQLKSNIETINLKEFFAVFYNFGQTLLQAKHLAGIFSAEIEFTGFFDKGLEITTENLQAKVKVNIEQGILENFEPLITLSRIFLRFKDFHKIAFAPIQNTFRIEEKRFFIPAMRIIAENFAFEVEGFYDINQTLDLRFALPKNNFRRNATNLNFEKDDLIQVRIKGSLDNLQFFNLTKQAKKQEQQQIKEAEALQEQKRQAYLKERQDFQKQREILKKNQ